MKSEMHVAALWRYPVKSMLGETCQTADVDRRGVVGDRMFAVRYADGKFGSGKNTRRFRKIDGLFEFSSAYEDGVAVVRFPDGSAYRIDDPDIDTALSNALRQPVSVTREGSVPHFDAGALHLVTTDALADLQRRSPDLTVDARRFRPNLVIDSAGEPLPDDDWIGKTVTINDVSLEIVDLTERCAMVTFSQSELPAEPGMLKSIAQHRNLQFGVYADVRTPGRIQCGDAVIVAGD